MNIKFFQPFPTPCLAVVFEHYALGLWTCHFGFVHTVKVAALSGTLAEDEPAKDGRWADEGMGSLLGQ